MHVLCKRDCSGAEPGVSFLASQTDKSTEQDWEKFTMLFSIAATAKEDTLTLEADDTHILN